MRRIVPHCPNMNYGSGFVHIIENAILAHANLPSGVKVFPGRNQAAQALSILGFHVRLMQKLSLDGFHDLLANERRQLRDFRGGFFCDSD